MSALAPELALLTDAERLVSGFLRRNARMAALVQDRVFTVFPAKAGSAPMLLVQRVGGEPPLSQPLVVDAAQLQLDAYGGPKALAHELAATARAVLTELEGTAQPEGICAGIRFGVFRWLPDETYTPPRPRYVFDVTATVRMAAVVPAAGKSAEPETEEE